MRMDALPAEAARKDLVAASWARAAAGRLQRDHVQPVASFVDEALDEQRSTSPLAAAMPVVRALLTEAVADGSGLVVAVGDELGRMLWIEGDPRAVALAESMRFVPGTDWSEARTGTNAPGTALALDRHVQIRQEEHFAVQAHPLSCTAVPLRDLATGRTIGVVDLTGGRDAVGPRSLPLVQAVVAAAEREIALQRLLAGAPRRGPAATGTPPRLSVLGRDRAELDTGDGPIGLSLRHAELLTLLAWHRDGITAERLAELVHGSRGAVVTIRPEMTRLRRLLGRSAPALVPLTRPYRLPGPLGLDARRVVSLLDRGAHRAALDAYRGEVLPGSVAPGIGEIRAEIDARLRESVLGAASPDLLLHYADRVAPHDPAPLVAALRMLPARSPRRAGVVARLAALA